MYHVPSRRPLPAPRPGERGGVPVCLLALGVFLAGAPSYPRAAPPPKPAPGAPPARGYLDPLFYRDTALGAVAGLRQREIVQMLSAVTSGSQMGPGEGWFHPGKGRYGWDWLAARFDTNRDGRITPQEFKGPRALFD